MLFLNGMTREYNRQTLVHSPWQYPHCFKAGFLPGQFELSAIEARTVLTHSLTVAQSQTSIYYSVPPTN